MNIKQDNTRSVHQLEPVSEYEPRGIRIEMNPYSLQIK